jgi:DNA-binding NarL/FixJ family response regulator
MIKIVIVDDFKETAESLSMLYGLRKDVQIVALAHNGDQLWSVLQEHEVDLISLDIQLGRENGLELCQIIHHKYPKIFTVICSVEATIENQRLAAEAGASYFLAKPVSIADISEAIDLFLRCQQDAGTDSSSLTAESLDDLFDSLG